MVTLMINTLFNNLTFMRVIFLILCHTACDMIMLNVTFTKHHYHLLSCITLSPIIKLVQIHYNRIDSCVLISRQQFSFNNLLLFVNKNSFFSNRKSFASLECNIASTGHPIHFSARPPLPRYRSHYHGLSRYVCHHYTAPPLPSPSLAATPKEHVQRPHKVSQHSTTLLLDACYWLVPLTMRHLCHAADQHLPLDLQVI